MRLIRVPFPVLLGIALTAASVAHAAGGRIPIHQVPTVIDSPGSYYLTRDLSGAPAAPIVTIATSDVTLDLAGHTLEHQGGSHPVIGSSGAPTRVEIFGGRIRGGQHGVYLLNVAGPTYDVRLHGLTIDGAADSGIYLEGGFEVLVPSRIEIDRTMVTNVGGHGIRLYAVDAARVTRNTVRDAGGAGIFLDSCDGVFVGHNTSASNTGQGVLVESTRASVIEGNHLVRNGTYGLEFRSSGESSTNCYIDNRIRVNSVGGLDPGSQYNNEQCSDNY